MTGQHGACERRWPLDKLHTLMRQLSTAGSSIWWHSLCNHAVLQMLVLRKMRQTAGDTLVLALLNKQGQQLGAQVSALPALRKLACKGRWRHDNPPEARSSGCNAVQYPCLLLCSLSGVGCIYVV
jgi:hypothetical protein